jgi:hypothetical protein
MYSQDLDIGFDLDTTALKKVQASYNNLDQMMIFKMSTVDKNLVKFLSAVDVYITHGEIFYTPPYGKLPIHVDLHEFSNNCKLNFIFGAAGSKMIWWDKKPNVDLSFFYTPIGTKYIMFEEDDCIPIHSARINQPSLVNIGIPHSIDNTTNEGRWCMSYTLRKIKDNNDLQWDDACILFDEYFKKEILND